jgi:hypothetical protein
MVAVVTLSVLAGSVAATAQSEAVQVGPGQVLVGETATVAGVGVDPPVRAAAAARLAGESIGIVLLPDVSGQGELPRDLPMAEGARDAIEALDAKPVYCTAVQFTRRQARCDRKDVAGLVAIAILPGSNLVAPSRLIRRGLPVVVIGAMSAEPPTDGSVRIQDDPAASGLAQGRAAGAYAAAAWPDIDPTVAITSFTQGGDAFSAAVAQGISEVLPAATVLPPTSGQLTDVGAHLYTGAIGANQVPVTGLAAGLFGGDLMPAFFLLACPETLPQEGWFAGCLRQDYSDLGTAAVDVIASIVGAGQVPAEIVVNPSTEVVSADGTVTPVDPGAAGEPQGSVDGP